MSRIKQEKQGIKNSLVFTNKNKSVGRIEFDGVGFEITSTLTVDSLITKANIEEISTTVVLTASDSGKTFFVNADSGVSAYTLPAPVAGLKYKWIVTANCDTATTITTADTTDTTGDMLRGGLLVCSAAAVNTFAEASGDVNKITLDDNVANNGQGIGSWLEIICTEDPTWFVTGVINSTTSANGVGSNIFSDVDAA